MITPPPKDRILNPFNKIAKSCPDKLESYLELFSPIDERGRYLHFDDIRFRLPKQLDLQMAWSVIKLARERQIKTLIHLGEPEKACGFVMTPTVQKAISETDRHTTNAALEWMLNKIGEHSHLQYLLKDLTQDEAINSSQLEGAATTTKAAKSLLNRKREPRTPDEKMILGNFKMMVLAWEKRKEKLSIDLLLNMHQVGVEDIDDLHYYPGTFRNSDDIVVVDAKNNILHTPPPVKGLIKRLESLVKWANSPHHNANSEDYIHPLVKAIVLHFAIGYEHPFRDGNGRVARALFYWFMFKNNFAAFRYIAISVLLKAAPARYGKSYLCTETDDMDLTYFIEYQCKVILRAVSAFRETYQETLKSIEDFNRWTWESGLYSSLSEKQKIIFHVAKANASRLFTTSEVEETLGCSYNTAAKALNGLVELNLFKKQKVGREWQFSMLSKDRIQKHWQY